MTGEEYIQQIENLMNSQNNYVNWILGIIGLLVAVLGIVIALAAYYQWWLNTKQMEQIKELTKQETIKEIEESLGVSSIEGFKNYVTKQDANIKNYMNYQFKDIVKERDRSDANQLYYKVVSLQYEETFLWRIPYIIDAYNRYISNNIHNFDSFVSQISGLITHTHNEGKLKEGINSPHIDIIINKLTEIEKGFNEKSKRLESLNKLIDMYKRLEK